MKSNEDIDQFAEAARQYCVWAEGAFGDGRDELKRARLLLAQLHLAAIRLPDLGIGKDKDAADIPHDEWALLFRKFGALPLKTYWDVFNPLEASEPVKNSLADDLSDIYRDVKSALALYEAGDFIDAAWHWRFNFQTHWGQHLAGAQRAVHEYFSEEDF